MYNIDFQHPIHIYFIGIGGISMSGLAEILLTEDFKVSGSDMRQSPLTEALKEKGAVVHYGQRAENLTSDIDLIVYTSAIHPDNPEFVTMKEMGIPHLSRAELLGQMMKNYKLPIAVSGTHGKTTTTSMISEILLENDCDPTLSIGGIFKTIGGNIRVGKSEYFVTEACEYTNSFLSFFPKIGIILNIEEDHLDFFKDIHDIRTSFHKFAKLLPADGTLIINGDIDNYEEITEGLLCQVVTCGSTPDCDYSYTNLHFDELAHASFMLNRRNGLSEAFSLMVPGEHNVHNAMAAIALADVLGIGSETVKKALLHFSGTDRRFEYKGKKDGVTIIDDYAHHPTEITATLKAAQNYPHNTLWCVFQPHTYTRTKSFLKEFAAALSLADKVVLSDIYAARETDNLGISSANLQSEINKLGAECFYLSSFEEIENFLSESCVKNDLLITMGAGDIVKVGENLLKK
ncbi:UDP-N-acetylmuramate--L-alanine ligase [Kineothrix alysoides]|uniref:UDP-N-acetylmuramate--L-alanine ligase n=1 Tax=Kineothrix alysoides TaxID=1469948 RepID=A0A4R1R664_9FIRM|nr:UDP-N-acetylmuramate--L-alanine ligase [Kineothrix alysoides]TCL61043.1 UDP-N-acetylmuramate--L-alanine ligase [Kineothrix alysoides]